MRSKARVWRALVDEDTLDLLDWPLPHVAEYVEVLEGGQVVDAIRKFWFERDVENATERIDERSRGRRRALARLACDADYGLAPRNLCERGGRAARKIVAFLLWCCHLRREDF